LNFPDGPSTSSNSAAAILFHRQRKREEKRAAFDREPPIAGHLSFPKRLAGRGASTYRRLRGSSGCNAQSAPSVPAVW
jgi:hypothetical protein